MLSCSTESYGLEEELPVVTIPETEITNQGRMIVAHRGAWWSSGAPRNSLAAFRSALEMNIYGSECDVRQTRDGRLVVCHDATHDGLSISKNDYSTLSQHLLGNGEPLPLLDDFLETLKSDNGKVRLVIELKSCKVKDLIALIEHYDVLNRVDFISFDLNLCRQLISSGLGCKTLLLDGSLNPSLAYDFGLGGIDYADNVYMSHPEWIAQARDIGLKVWVWTVNDPEIINDYLSRNVMVTTDRP